MAASKRDVQSNQQTSRTSSVGIITPAFSSNPATGDTIVVFVGTGGNIGIGGVTDTAGNTYTQVGTTVNGNFGQLMRVYIAVNITGGSSFAVTAKPAATADMSIVAWCLTGVAASPYNGDITIASLGSSTTPTSGTSSPAPAANSFFIGACISGTDMTAAGTGWQVETNSRTTNTGIGICIGTEDLVATTSSSAQSATMTLGGSDNWGACVLSFAPGGGSTTYTQSLTAALTFVGAITKRTSTSRTGGLTIRRSITGTLSFVGTLVGHSPNVIVPSPQLSLVPIYDNAGNPLFDSEGNQIYATYWGPTASRLVDVEYESRSADVSVEDRWSEVDGEDRGMEIGDE